MTKALLIGCLALAAVGIGLSAQAPRPMFDVASIKRLDKPPTPSFQPPIRGGIVTIPSTNVVSLIQMAYDLRDFQVVDGPDWVRRDLFEVQARATGEPAYATVLLMLQSLLEERFALRLRKEQREIRYLAMKVARDDRRVGPSFRAGTHPADCLPTDEASREETKRKEASGHVTAELGCAPLPRLAAYVSLFVALPVLDRTGLTGDWGGTLYHDRNVGPLAGRAGGPDPNPNLPTFTSALRDQFGLKLESTRGPVDVHVIDSVRQPTEN